VRDGIQIEKVRRSKQDFVLNTEGMNFLSDKFRFVNEGL